MTNILYEARSELLPGELNEEFAGAWLLNSKTMRLIEQILATNMPADGAVAVVAKGPREKPLMEKFEESQLASPAGDYERSTVTKAIDWFLRLWHGPEPRTIAQKQAAMRAGARVHNLGGVLLDSLSAVVQTSLPAAASAKALSEFCSFTSQGLDVNAARYDVPGGHVR